MNKPRETSTWCVIPVTKPDLETLKDKELGSQLKLVSHAWQIGVHSGFIMLYDRKVFPSAEVCDPIYWTLEPENMLQESSELFKFQFKG